MFCILYTVNGVVLLADITNDFILFTLTTLKKLYVFITYGCTSNVACLIVVSFTEMVNDTLASSSISFYSINNRSTAEINVDQVPSTIAIPANPNSKTDYIDYIWIPKPSYNEVYIYCKTHKANNAMIYSSQIS